MFNKNKNKQHGTCVVKVFHIPKAYMVNTVSPACLQNTSILFTPFLLTLTDTYLPRTHSQCNILSPTFASLLCLTQHLNRIFCTKNQTRETQPLSKQFETDFKTKNVLESVNSLYLNNLVKNSAQPPPS